MRSQVSGLAEVTRGNWIAFKKMRVGPPKDTVEPLTYTRLLEINVVLQGIINVGTPRQCPPTY